MSIELVNDLSANTFIDTTLASVSHISDDIWGMHEHGLGLDQYILDHPISFNNVSPQDIQLDWSFHLMNNNFIHTDAAGSFALTGHAQHHESSSFHDQSLASMPVMDPSISATQTLAPYPPSVSQFTGS